MLADDVVALIRRMAKENHTWGAKRIRGELHKLGIEVAKSTIQRYLSDLRTSRIEADLGHLSAQPRNSDMGL